MPGTTVGQAKRLLNHMGFFAEAIGPDAAKRLDENWTMHAEPALMKVLGIDSMEVNIEDRDDYDFIDEMEVVERQDQPCGLYRVGPRIITLNTEGMSPEAALRGCQAMLGCGGLETALACWRADNSIPQLWARWPLAFPKTVLKRQGKLVIPSLQGMSDFLQKGEAFRVDRWELVWIPIDRLLEPEFTRIMCVIPG